jgi:adenine nucleotide transporter 17
MADSAGLSALIQASGGATGAVVATVVLQPLEVVKTRIQVEQFRTLSAYSAASEIIAKHGVLALFRGLGTKAIDSGSRYFLYYFAYDAIGGLARRISKMTTGVNLAVGYLAGVVAVTGTQPFDTAGTKLAAGTMKGSLFSVLIQTLRKEGLQGLYTGYGFNLALCTNPAIANTLFDKIKSAILQQRIQNSLKQPAALSPFQSFLLGAFTKAIAVLVTYPLTRLKTILQAGEVDVLLDEAGASSVHKRSQEERFSFKDAVMKAYTGLNSQLLKAVLQAAFLFMTKEQIEQVVRRMFLSVRKLVHLRSPLLAPSN